VSGPDHSTTFSLGQLVAAAMAAGARQGLIFLDAAGAQGAVDPALSQVLGDIPAGWSVVWLPPERSDSRLSNVDAVVLALTIAASGDGANPATFAGLRDALKIASQFGDRALLFTRSPDLAIGSGRQ
jgi:hypothetical protein